MLLQATNWKEDPTTGAITYDIVVTADDFHIATVSVAVALPTPANIRIVQKAALRANKRVRVQELLEKQGRDLENG